MYVPGEDLNYMIICMYVCMVCPGNSSPVYTAYARQKTPSLDPHINQNFITDIHTYIHAHIQYMSTYNTYCIYSLTSERALQRVQDLLKSLVMAKGHLRQLGGVSEDDVQRENELQEHKRYQGTCSPLWILHM